MKRIARGLGTAVRARPGLFVASVIAVMALDVWLPPLLLSATRKPWTYFAFNPWLKKLPSYLVGPAPTAEKLDFLARVALFWFSADGDYGAPEWGFAVDTMDVARFVAMGLLVGLYVTLAVRPPAGAQWRIGWTRKGGSIGALASVVGLSTGPCSVVGCGAPVLPVVGLVFAGLSSETLAFLSGASRVLTLVVFATLAVSVAYLAWHRSETAA